MFRHSLTTFSLLVVALLCLQSPSMAANLAGTWDVSVDDGQAGTIDFPMVVTQSIVFINVSEERPTGTVTGLGISPGPLVIWFDEANSVFVGRADSPRQPTSITGLIVVNFEGLQISTWTATKQAP